MATNNDLYNSAIPYASNVGNMPSQSEFNALNEAYKNYQKSTTQLQKDQWKENSVLNFLSFGGTQNSYNVDKIQNQYDAHMFDLAYSKMLSDTAIRRKIADLKASGINPLVMFANGPGNVNGASYDTPSRAGQFDYDNYRGLNPITAMLKLLTLLIPHRSISDITSRSTSNSNVTSHSFSESNSHSYNENHNYNHRVYSPRYRRK